MVADQLSAVFGALAELRAHVVERFFSECGQVGQVAKLARDDRIGIH